jgi:hypothetical protein
MRRISRYFLAVAVALPLAMVTGSTADAGVIPWLYDAVFGPVHYGPYYGGSMPGGSYYRGPMAYAPSYAMRPVVVSGGYSSCNSGCGPVVRSACGPGGCTPQTTFYSPCGPSGCGTTACTPAPNSVNSQKVTVAQPIAEKNPIPKTFVADEPQKSAIEQVDAVVEKPAANKQTVTATTSPTGEAAASATAEPDTDPFISPKGSGAAASDGLPFNVEAPATDQPVSPTAPSGNAGFGATVRGDDAAGEEDFVLPGAGVEELKTITPGVPTPTLPEGGLGAELNQPAALNLDLKRGWTVKTAPPTRLSLRAGFRSATVARSTVPVQDDYRIRKAVETKIAGR